MSLIPKPTARACDTGELSCIDCIGRENCTLYGYEYVLAEPNNKPLKVIIEDSSICADFDKDSCTITVKQDISFLLRNNNILPFTDENKLYFMDKTTMQIVAEFDKANGI